MHRIVKGATLSAVLMVTQATAAELLMLEQPGCAWCARFNAEIAPAYPNTMEGKQAPLRRIDITKDWPADLAGVPIERFTPTFVLMDESREIGRIRGYPGDEFFWYLLGDLITKLAQLEESGTGTQADPEPSDHTSAVNARETIE